MCYKLPEEREYVYYCEELQQLVVSKEDKGVIPFCEHLVMQYILMDVYETKYFEVILHPLGEL